MSEIIVLDTHIWLWFVNSDFHQFPNLWLEQIESAQRVGISPVSCFEVALAHKRGRITLTMKLEEWFQQALEPSGIEIFPLTPEIAAKAVDLSPVHRDPFDRIIIATSLDYQAPLASLDGQFPYYPELRDKLMTP
ncbi:MAG: type II toxin-antitoxin system VapC family toxin [SAR324 cluster bacterium]|nr:type II toxin-antitoxin system VapC family toxin [SAR324 cluster bacterium]